MTWLLLLLFGWLARLSQWADQRWPSPDDDPLDPDPLDR
jgi:hypothetical protein